MFFKKFTIETRFNPNDTLKEYLESNIEKQSSLFRIIFSLVQSSELKLSKLNTYIQNKYNVDKRTANSLIKTAKGRIKAYWELKKYELSNLETIIVSLTLKIDKLVNTVTVYKTLATKNLLNEELLDFYRKQKKLLWHNKQKLNKIKQKRDLLKKDISNKKIRICWGTKSMFKKQFNLVENDYKSHQAWLNDFRMKRDSQINFIGSISEPQGNQNCQLSYDNQQDNFRLKVRKDLELMNGLNDKFVFINELNFKHYRNKLIKYLSGESKTITTRIKRWEKKWYLQIIFSYEVDTSYSTTSTYGTIGLDFNVGFIELSETDRAGNLINQWQYKLGKKGCSNAAKSLMRECAAHIVKLAKEKGKDLIIEDLDFKKTKAKTMKTSKNKKYNKMINAFDYSRYKECFENACYRNNVNLKMINSAYTSKIGEVKYANIMKLSTHQAASYVIARKGQGYIDKL